MSKICTKKQVRISIEKSLKEMDLTIPLCDNFTISTLWEERENISDYDLDNFIKRENNTEYWAIISLRHNNEEISTYYPSTSDIAENFKGLIEDFYNTINNFKEN